MKILVTGAKGFVGKNLCAQLKNIRSTAETPAMIARILDRRCLSPMDML